jgi:hypothetical protein
VENHLLGFKISPNSDEITGTGIWNGGWIMKLSKRLSWELVWISLSCYCLFRSEIWQLYPAKVMILMVKAQVRGKAVSNSRWLG